MSDIKSGMHAYIEYALRDTTAEEVQQAFDRELKGSFVSHIEEGITQDYKGYWKSFTIFFNDSGVFENLTFHSVFDRYVLYYNETEYWDVYLRMKQS